MQEPEDPTRVHCPAPAADKLRRLVEAASKLEDRAYQYELVPLRPGDRVQVRPDFALEAFATEHPVPSLGYHLLRRRGRLAEQYRGLAPTEIARLRESGADVTEWSEELTLSYCGDTGSAVFEIEPRLFESRVLMVETTYISPGLRARAREYGHLHVDDLRALAERFQNEAIILHHLSRRHRPVDLRRAIDERLPLLAERVKVWGALEARGE